MYKLELRSKVLTLSFWITANYIKLQKTLLLAIDFLSGHLLLLNNVTTFLSLKILLFTS